MQVTQIQVAHDSIEDRLVLRIGTAGHEEIRVHVTRRYLRELWPHLIALLADHLAPAQSVTASLAAPPPAGTSAPGAGASTSFDQPYRNDNPTFPLGSRPILASEASIEPSGPGSARLIMREARERAFTLNLTADLLQALCAMLRAASSNAQWDLGLDYEQTPRQRDAVTTPAAPASKKPVLH